MIRQLFRQVDFSSIRPVSLTDLTCTRDKATRFSHRWRSKDNRDKNYDHMHRSFESKVWKFLSMLKIWVLQWRLTPMGHRHVITDHSMSILGSMTHKNSKSFLATRRRQKEILILCVLSWVKFNQKQNVSSSWVSPFRNVASARLTLNMHGTIPIFSFRTILYPRSTTSTLQNYFVQVLNILNKLNLLHSFLLRFRIWILWSNIRIFILCDCDVQTITNIMQKVLTSDFPWNILMNRENH